MLLNTFSTQKGTKQMKINVREYEEADLAQMIRIWNEVVEDGEAFPQEEELTEETGREFLRPRLTAEWRRMRRQRRFSAYISCIPIMWDAAGISAMPAMR